MKRKYAALILLCLICAQARGNMIMEKSERTMKVFYTMNDREGWYAVLTGKIISYSSKDEYDAADLFASAQDKSKATVRLYSAEGIHEGDVLYVINDKNLIVAKMKVRTVFKSPSFGDMLVGYGNFRLSSIGDRVIRKAEEEDSRYSYIFKARGDFYENTGRRGEAIKEYKTALKMDKKNPSAHLALGLVYMEQGLDQFALRELKEGYRAINYLYDNEDRFLLLRSLAEIRFREVYESFVPEKLKESYRREGITFCKEALRVYPKSERMNYYLGVFHYRAPEPDDKIARDYFLKVLDINPRHSGASVALAELYYRHDNMKKARGYAEKAIDADRTNRRARDILKYIESKKQLD
ncbi:MAG: tetratricopeptide repeat protein [Spirochaetes bacterium]|nr:tetratricopeptide repeat protein [Spirochaetota bacterium]